MGAYKYRDSGKETFILITDFEEGSNAGKKWIR